jgi:hypothetical protein
MLLDTRNENIYDLGVGISIYPRMICTQFGWDCPAGSGEDFKKFQCIFTILLLSPIAIHLNNFECLRMICVKFG